MKRLDFIKRVATAVVVGVPFVLLATNCSTSDPLPNTNPNTGPKSCLDNGTSSDISANHGHDLTVSKDDVQAGVPKSYSIGNGVGHDHNVTITASQFSSLKNNQSIQTDSTSGGGGHIHSITVSCA